MNIRPAHVRNLLGPVVRRLYRIRVHGAANLPIAGATLAVCPSEGVLATPAVLSVLSRPAHAIPNLSLSSVIGGAGVRGMGGIELSGAGALETQRRALHLLSQGTVVALFGSAVSPGWLIAAARPVLVPIIVIGGNGRIATDTPRIGTVVDVFIGPAVPSESVFALGEEHVAPNRSQARVSAEWCRQIVSDAYERAIQRTGGLQ